MDHEKYTTKAHLLAHHAGEKSHHETMAQCEMAKAEHDRDLAAVHEELDQPEIAKIHKSYAKTHQKAAAHHTAEAGRHKDLLKAIETMASTSKAMGGHNPNDLVPDNVGGVITPVPRAGQPSLDKAAVDPIFEHLVEMPH